MTLSPNRSFHPEMLQWLIVPALLIWFSASYLLGVAAQPVWQAHQNSRSAQVLAVNAEPAAHPNNLPVFHWQQTGLITLWFDDGWLTQYTVAAPILQESGYPAAIAVTTDLVGYEAYISWGQIKRLYHAYGWEVAAHSRSHNCDATTFSPENVKNEILGSQQDLNAQGLPVDSYVVPCGVITTVTNSARQR